MEGSFHLFGIHFSLMLCLVFGRVSRSEIELFLKYVSPRSLNQSAPKAPGSGPDADQTLEEAMMRRAMAAEEELAAVRNRCVPLPHSLWPLFNVTRDSFFQFGGV